MLGSWKKRKGRNGFYSGRHRRGSRMDIRGGANRFVKVSLTDYRIKFFLQGEKLCSVEGERRRELRKEAKTYRERCGSGVLVVPSKSPRSRPVRDTSFSSLADRSCLCDQSNPSCSPFPSSFCQSCGHRPRCDRILTPCSFEINLAVYREVNLHRISFFFFSSFPSYSVFLQYFFFIFYFIFSLPLFLLLFFFFFFK